MLFFNSVQKQSGIGFIVDALFGNFPNLLNLYTAVELHTNIVLIHFESQLMCGLCKRLGLISILLGYKPAYIHTYTYI